MEEAKPAMGPPPPPAPPTTKKRPLEDSNAHSNYFKIRAVIRDLRPHFLEVLRTPDYKNCKASHEIQEQLKIVVKLYENMKADAASLAKSKNVQDGQMKAGQNMDQKTLKEQQPQHGKQSQVEKSFARPSEIKLTPPAPGFQKQLVEETQTQGTYVVGGSAFGWNFITFSGKEPVYYGRTKEQFRSAKVTE
ncbi:hypothetical protein AAZX31_18G213000 [Glycine max]|uniref:Uncharacterized protein n=2 Tax=Glycine subgen. Soja TaxID=1462606 RepID=C6SYV1_SOYBN|nr:uncharacterized protein LOC100306306 [Glycine max]XP_028215733.1 uncharacterized protein LOC114397744 [Glycine soja]ACU14424.1 unknown [Glycine max]KAG4922424.1 hypothetical protein JHK86_051237 [Glycine max]KAG5095675.1 hypothetical protein JHK84_051263 [Glycine max]KAH1155785.1 hypothetical protein GYH30_050868 [Glycine max]KAH1199737.1 hypothetical protein GmHk_18G053022 [Glycine max]|eukprot:NP_001236776.1 uncharacterized protein LOC100306306 [Glycine max]